MDTEKLKKLHDFTGAGLMNCKNALLDCGGDFDAAVAALKASGLADVALMEQEHWLMVELLRSRQAAGNQATGSASKSDAAGSNEHYVLACRDCGFTHSVPRDCNVPPTAFSVDVKAAKLQCVYGGVFQVTLDVGDFFTAARVPESGAVLRASIADNMKVLNDHILSHCDPVYLVIRQSENRTEHSYKRQPAGSTYVSVSKAHGTDIVGNIDVSKAEIPGVSW